MKKIQKEFSNGCLICVNCTRSKNTFIQRFKKNKKKRGGCGPKPRHWVNALTPVSAGCLCCCATFHMSRLHEISEVNYCRKCHENIYCSCRTLWWNSFLDS